MTQKQSNILIIILLLLVGFFGYQYYNTSQDLQEQVTLTEAANAKMETWRGKDGLNRAKIQALETRNSEAFLKMATNDSSILALQYAVKGMERYLRDQGSVTNFSTETGISTSSETEVIPNDTLPEFPSYRSEFDLDGWVYGSTLATKDSTHLDLRVKNSYTLTVGVEPQGFLGMGKGKAFAEVKNLNPYSETTDLRTYQVTVPKQKKFGVGIIAGYGVGGSLAPSLIVGVGVSWTPIKF